MQTLGGQRRYPEAEIRELIDVLVADCWVGIRVVGIRWPDSGRWPRCQSVLVAAIAAGGVAQGGAAGRHQPLRRPRRERSAFGSGYTPGPNGVAPAARLSLLVGLAVSTLVHAAVRR